MLYDFHHLMIIMYYLVSKIILRNLKRLYNQPQPTNSVSQRSLLSIMLPYYKGEDKLIKINNSNWNKLEVNS